MFCYIYIYLIKTCKNVKNLYFRAHKEEGGGGWGGGKKCDSILVGFVHCSLFNVHTM